MEKSEISRRHHKNFHASMSDFTLSRKRGEIFGGKNVHLPYCVNEKTFITQSLTQKVEATIVLRYTITPYSSRRDGGRH